MIRVMKSSVMAMWTHESTLHILMLTCSSVELSFLKFKKPQRTKKVFSIVWKNTRHLTFRCISNLKYDTRLLFVIRKISWWWNIFLIVNRKKWLKKLPRKQICNAGWIIMFGSNQFFKQSSPHSMCHAERKNALLWSRSTTQTWYLFSVWLCFTHFLTPICLDSSLFLNISLDLDIKRMYKIFYC